VKRDDDVVQHDNYSNIIVMKKSRDQVLDRMRIQKNELTDMKSVNTQLSNSIRDLEKMLLEKEHEKNMLLTLQKEAKELYVQNLNSQKISYNEDIDKKNERILELETLMMSKIRMADSSRE
jgi:hypothetical protein